MKQLRVSVTQDDIDSANLQRTLNYSRGTWSSSTMCPIARALHRQGYPHVQVRNICVFLADPDVKVELPKRAQAFTVAFDRHLPVFPSEFRLRVPE